MLGRVCRVRVCARKCVMYVSVRISVCIGLCSCMRRMRVCVFVAFKRRLCVIPRETHGCAGLSLAEPRHKAAELLVHFIVSFGKANRNSFVYGYLYCLLQYNLLVYFDFVTPIVIGSMSIVKNPVSIYSGYIC